MSASRHHRHVGSATERRPREYLTPAEVETLIVTARKRGRYCHRDATMILLAYRHGLCVSELVGLSWDQVDFTAGLLHVAPQTARALGPVL
jgi:type 1 fimbriae regulatory protein FimB/type 1 fimbriae regulatory protein FimE